MNNGFPHELSLGDVYFSPILVVLVIAFLATGITVLILNKLKLSRYIYAYAYIFVAIMVLYIVLIDAFLIKF
jgi:hypothetical protein